MALPSSRWKEHGILVLYSYCLYRISEGLGLLIVWSTKATAHPFTAALPGEEVSLKESPWSTLLYLSQKPRRREVLPSNGDI